MMDLKPTSAGLSIPARPPLARHCRRLPWRRQPRALGHCDFGLYRLRASRSPFPAPQAAPPAIGASHSRLHTVLPAAMPTLGANMSRGTTPGLIGPGYARHHHFFTMMGARAWPENTPPLRPPPCGLLEDLCLRTQAMSRVHSRHRPIQLSPAPPRLRHRRLVPLE